MPYQPRYRVPNPATVLRSLRREQDNALLDTARYVQAKAAKYPPQNPASSYRRTGTLGRSISHGQPKGPISSRSIEVGTNLHYGPYVEYGTGIYGPRGVPITPKQARFLAWKAGGKWVIARSVRGMKPWYYMRKAFTGQETVRYFQQRQGLMLSRIARLLNT